MKVRSASGPTSSLHVLETVAALPDDGRAGRFDAPHVSLPLDRATLERFRELRERANGSLDASAAKAIVRELKAVGGNLRAVRRALTGRESGPELWSIVAALSREETLRRVDGAL